jgi:endonuclease YncB( thermonuclease family)
MGNCIYKIYDKPLRKASNKFPLFSLKGNLFNCKIVDVYDGDTCTAIIRTNHGLQKHKIRMLGYDSPEMKPLKIAKNRDKEILAAKEAKEKLISKISNNKDLSLNTKMIKIECYDWDKYGRLLGVLKVKNLNVNQWMIDNNYGYPYDGGTKKKFK